MVQRSAAYLEILTVEEALPRDKPRRFGAEDVSTWEESCHEVWAVKPPVFREVKRYVGDFEAFSTLTWGRVSVFGLERREKREGEGEKRGREERREKVGAAEAFWRNFDLRDGGPKAAGRLL